MSQYCEDCGTRMWSSGCPNCQEEKCIYDNQWHEDPFPLSDEFQQKVKEQTKLLNDRNETKKTEKEA